VHTERWPNARLHSSFLDQTNEIRPVTPAHVTTSMQLASRASDHVGKASAMSASHWGQTRSSVGVSYENTYRSCRRLDECVSSEANDRWHGKRCGYSAHVMFQLLIGWHACHLSGRSWNPMKWRWMSHMADKPATIH